METEPRDQFQVLAEQVAERVLLSWVPPGWEERIARVVVAKTLELHPEMREIPAKILEIASANFVSELAAALLVYRICIESEFLQ